jgi:tRNA (guanine37-N1)-methyltransferase
MKFDILTLFPEMFEVFNYSIIGRAKEKELIEINTYNIRNFTNNKHKKVDDYPYGGGAGMIMQAEPIYNTIDKIIEVNGFKPYTVLMTPRGIKYTQAVVKELVDKKHIMLICGHYEGIDERIMPLIDMEISLGDFVLTGGEIASMAIIDSVSRLVPEVLTSPESYEAESFYEGLLEYPQYTRPEDFRGLKVPEVLISGHHANIRDWRRYQSLKATLIKRPDLFSKVTLSKNDKKLLDKFKNEIEK